MAVTKKIASKDAAKQSSKAELPVINDEIFKLKIDRETQQFFIEGLDNYGKFDEVTLRPLDMRNKIVAYTDDFKVKAESTLYRDLKEATDSQGNAAKDEAGKICGRVIWKNLTDKLSEENKASNKEQAKFYAMVFGVASIPGKDPVLVDFRLGGTKFMEIINILKKIKDEKKEYNRAELKLKAYPNENPEFDWPELDITPDFSRELPLTGLEPLFDTIEGYVEFHNDGIRKKAEKYKAWKASGGKSNYNKPTSYKRK